MKVMFLKSMFRMGVFKIENIFNKSEFQESTLW